MTNVTPTDALEAIRTLTARQREVLALVAKGLTNPEIADRLGITRDGVKWHVGEILGRTGLDTREEAADLWRRYNGLPYRLHRLAGAVVGIRMSRWLFGGVGATAVAGLAVVLFVLVVHRSDSPSDQDDLPATVTTTASTTPVETPTTTASATPVTTATAVPTQGLLPGARVVSSIEDTSFPPDTSLLVVDGPYGKDGGPFDLRRVYRVGDGPVQQTMLYKPEGAVFILSVLADAAGDQIYLSQCETIDCPALGESPGITTTFLRSLDGGVTWAKVGTADGKWGVTAFFNGDAIAGRAFGQQLQFIDVVTGAQVDVPASLARDQMFNAGGQPGWWDREALDVRGISGNAIFTPGGFDSTGFGGIEILLNGPGGADAVTVSQTYESAQAAGGKQWQYLMRYPQGVNGEPTIVAFPDGAPRLGGWIDKDHLVVTANYQRPGTCGSDGTTVGADPAILDVASGTLSFIRDPFYDPACSHSTQQVVAVQTGPLAQVNAGGDCLNIRSEPSTSAGVALCLADGALATVTGAAQKADGHEWLPITAPDGTTGYAAAEFLSVGQGR